MKIAVIGAGLSGLAFSWHYKKANPSHTLTLFDPKKPAERTSSLANLLYPFVGMRSKLNWRGFEALEQSQALLKEVSAFHNKTIYREISLLKIPSNQKEKEAFYRASQDYCSLEWREETPFHKPGLWLDKVTQVDGLLYLEALLNACLSLGIDYKRSLFTQNYDKDFDLIIVASGYHSKLHFLTQSSCLKGQAVIIKMPPDQLHLRHGVIYEGLHLIPSIDFKTLYIGNTFERQYKNITPCLKTIKELLWPKLLSIYPSIDENLIVAVKAGIRLTAPSRLPKIGKVDEKKWIFSAFGSKGLLYHSYLGRLLTGAICRNSNDTIPQNILFTPES